MRKPILILGHNDATQFIDIYNQYTRLFDQTKYEVTVAYLTTSYKEDVKQRTIAEHVLFLGVPSKTLRGLKIGAINQLLQLTREKQFEVVICHRYKPTYIMLWVSLFAKIPALVFVMHELGTMSNWGRKQLTKLMTRKNMLFAGVSNAVRDDMRKDMLIPKEQIATLYNVIDVELTEPDFMTREQARAALNLAADDFVFCNLARLSPNKDQHTLIAAFAKIKPTCPRAKLLIIGDGELEVVLKQQVEQLGLTNDVLFMGFMPQAFRYLKAFDCFTLSSIQEAFGRVLIEAMLAKLPVIATSVNGIPEVVGNAGTLVTAKNMNALSEHMLASYQASDEVRKQQGELAYQHVVTHFSIPAFQKQFWELPLLQTV